MIDRAVRCRRTAAVAGLVMCLASLAGLSRALALDQDRAEGPLDVAVHRLGGTAQQLRFEGETAARTFPVFLTAREAATRARLRVAYANAVSVMPEASRIRISVNDVLVSDTPITAPTAADAEDLDIEIPPSLLEPGYNAVKFEAQQRHRVDCSLAATYELWTQVDPARTGFTFPDRTADTRSIGELADLPALQPAADGASPLRLVVPKGIDSVRLDRILRAAQAVAIRGRFAYPAFEVVDAPAERPGLDIVVGTTDELSGSSLADTNDDAQNVWLKAGPSLGQSILTISGRTGGELDAAIVAFAAEAGTDALPGTPAGVRAAALAGGKPVEGGSVLTLRELGVTSQEFSGRLYRTGFDLLMPPDFYAADYGKMTLRIDAGYAAGLAKGSQLLVRVNDKDAASLPLPNPDGDVFRDRPVTVPLSHLRPGFNHVQIEAQVPAAADKQCDAAATIGGQRRFVLLDDTTLELPSIARIAHLPNLAVTAASGFPYTRAHDGVLFLPHPDADTVAAAATFLSRIAAAAGAPLGLELLVGKPPSDARPAIVIGGFKDIPPAMLQAAGLNATSMRDTWANVEASTAASARLRQSHGASPGQAAALSDRRDGATLFRQWSDDVSAGHWRFDPVKMVTDALDKLVGGASGWRGGETPYAVAQGARILLAQHAGAQHPEAVLTVLTAPSGELLGDAVRDLISAPRWSELDGRVAALDPSSRTLDVVLAAEGRFIPTSPLSAGNIRLIAAGWLSSSLDVYVGGFLLIAVALGLSTGAVVKRYGTAT